ncbi:MAG: ABC transporter permease [Actinomycetota bacterium]|nr:ABC transporter permease [Actinomycetota bacterium]MDA3020693.1 ABC transporter permease [Actinomycetota bacterium]
MSTIESEVLAAPKRSLLNRLGLDRFSALYLWGAFMIIFGLWKSDTFLSMTSVKLVLGENVSTGILALAFLVPFCAATFDLSIGAVMSMSVVTMCFLSDEKSRSFNMPVGVAAVITLVVCTLIGVVSGFIVVKLKVNSFIATLGLGQVISAIVLKISFNRQITDVYSETFEKFGRNQYFGIPVVFFYLAVAGIIIWYVLEHTPVGRFIYATGGNPEAARLAGVKTDRMVWGSLIASSFLAGVAGIVFSAKVGLFTAATGPNYLFPAIAAVFFGASQLKGRPNVAGTFIALYALAFGIKGLQLVVGTDSYWVNPMFQGTTLIIAVSLASQKGIARMKKRKVKTA